MYRSRSVLTQHVEHILESKPLGAALLWHQAGLVCIEEAQVRRRSPPEADRSKAVVVDANSKAGDDISLDNVRRWARIASGMGRGSRLLVGAVARIVACLVALKTLALRSFEVRLTAISRSVLPSFGCCT